MPPNTAELSSEEYEKINTRTVNLDINKENVFNNNYPSVYSEMSGFLIYKK